MKFHVKTYGAEVFKATPNSGAKTSRNVPEAPGTQRSCIPAWPYSLLHFPPKCEYVFMYSSHGLSKSQTPNTDALYNFPVFSAAGNLSGVCLIFLSLCDLLNCFGGSRLSGDWRQARSFTPDRARPHIRVGVC